MKERLKAFLAQAMLINGGLWSRSEPQSILLGIKENVYFLIFLNSNETKLRTSILIGCINHSWISLGNPGGYVVCRKQDQVFLLFILISTELLSRKALMSDGSILWCHI